MKKILLVMFVACFIETGIITFLKNEKAGLSFGAAQGVMFLNLILLTILWRSIIRKKKIAHISVLIVIKSLFLILSAWVVLKKIAPEPMWSLAGFAAFFGTLTFAGLLRK